MEIDAGPSSIERTLQSVRDSVWGRWGLEHLAGEGQVVRGSNGLARSLVKSLEAEAKTSARVAKDFGKASSWVRAAPSSSGRPSMHW